MKNQEKLQKNFDKYTDLIKQADNLRAAIDIDGGIYVFCCHLHDKNPMFSGWKDLVCNDPAEFEIKDGLVYSKSGRYDDETVQAMQGIIEDWLKQGE